MPQTLTTVEPPATVNGCRVLAAKPLMHDHTTMPGHVVLCERHDGSHVTWTIGTEGGQWHAFWGHYYDLGDTLTDAVEDFRNREA